MNQTFTKIITSSTIVCCSFLAFATNEPNYPNGFTPKTLSGISFTENKGQVSDQYFRPRPDVLFGGTDGNLVFHLKNNGISYQLNKIDTWKDVEDIRTKEKRKEIDKSTIYRLDINWLNANTHARIVKGAAYEGYNNYYLETCPNGALNVQSFEEVTYQNIYSGIDLKWYQKDGHLKYDYIVAAGANYKNIQLQIKGASNVKINEIGELIISTPLGDIIEQAPLVIQNQKVLKAKWLLKETETRDTHDGEYGRVLSFEIKNLIPNQAFVIDPIVRVWGTYYGGDMNDVANSCTSDPSGNVYLSGDTTPSANAAIATTGSHQFLNGGGYDAFLVKFNVFGQRLWGTYYGGISEDHSFSLTSDANGNVYMAGYTASTASLVISTTGAHQPVHGGGYDAFLVKFNSNGIRQWGTYYGGTSTDYGYSCASDVSGNVYLAGWTDSGADSVIGTAGAHQSIQPGMGDAFLAKFNSAGVRLWGTYYGGGDYDIANSCTCDGSGNVYLAGATKSNFGNAIATAGAHQTGIGGGAIFNAFNAFLVKFNSLGVRQWGTYYGGSETFGNCCSSDASGNIYLAGYSYCGSLSANLIGTTGSHQSWCGGFYDAYLVKFDSTGIRQWGTFYGGQAPDYGNSCSNDANGNVYLTGYTGSNTWIASPGAYQDAQGGTSEDAFLVKFNSSGARQWGTYYGGSGSDRGASCIIDVYGNIYLAGRTSSNVDTVIATTGAYQSTNISGNFDGFLVQFLDCSNACVNTISSNGVICAGESATLTAGGANSYTWNGGSNLSSIIVSPTVTTTYIVNGTIENCGKVSIATITQSVAACTNIHTRDNSTYLISIYPNPNNGQFQLVSESPINLTLMNDLGQVLKTISLNESNKNTVSINEFVNGIYFIVGQNNNQVIKQKVVVDK